MASTEEGSARRIPTIPSVESARLAFALSVVATIVVGGAFWLLLVQPTAGGIDFHHIDNRIQFAGSVDRLSGELNNVTLGEARWAVTASLAFALVWGVVGAALLASCWDAAWHTGPGHDLAGKLLGVSLAGGGFVAALVEKLLTLLSLTTTAGAVTHRNGVLAALVVAFAWIKWLLAGLLICAVFVLLVSVATRASRRMLPSLDPNLPHDLPDAEVERAAEPSGIGVCCSGGGIRSAAFALGGLSRLERPIADGAPDVLSNASYLASVSGGGYAAAAWRIAAGTNDLPSRPIIGDPSDPDRRAKLEAHKKRPGGGSMDLFDHIRRRRHYLSNGPGGVLRSLTRVVAHTTFHFFLVVTTVFFLAWPVGRIIVGWAVTGAGVQPGVLTGGLTPTPIGPHRWFPPLLLLVVAGVAMLAYLGEERTKLRSALDVVIRVAIGMGLLVFTITIVLPWAVDRFLALLPDGGSDQIALGGIYGLIVNALWQFAKSRLQPVARYLGGVFLGIGLAAFALYVMANAATVDGLLSSPCLWLGAMALLIIVFIFFNPDRWSLHPIYRDGLTGTFASRWDDQAGIVRPLSPADEPPLAAYRAAAGPMPVVCCAAARQDSGQTGIKVLSMTFDPHAITVHGWGQNESGRPVHSPYQISHARFHQRLPKDPVGFAGTRRAVDTAERTVGYGLHTLMGAVAISGAAVAPSLGRMDMKSTNALLAAFNARLGVWVPNPTHSSERSTTPRVVNMFKEILGMYRFDDPNVYATDGGHWENLGLVELIRRRCRTIICIDASGDAPGTYKALHEAIDLADLECEATIDLSDALNGELRSADGARPKKNYGRGAIIYSDGKRSDLIYLKAAVAGNSPIHIRRYAAGDRRFPNYSTSDQFLGEEEFVYMVQLGYDAMDRALTEHGHVVAEAMIAEREAAPPGR
ncbi:MAG: hypothetical protein OER95_02345 [Acidimicrobiia bacterium]|nr:hypothetical protein [Acidimicrobiia bacterium]